jgi:hypothetical protein
MIASRFIGDDIEHLKGCLIAQRYGFFKQDYSIYTIYNHNFYHQQGLSNGLRCISYVLSDSRSNTLYSELIFACPPRDMCHLS